MEIGQQIKKIRVDSNVSQEELAEKIYVSRQTISNWENNKSYPDVKSLLLVSSLFKISLDELVKGDIEEMEKQINTEDVIVFNKNANIFSTLFIAMLITPIPLSKYLGYVGLAIWGIIVIICIYFCIKVEKQKKNLDLQTYKEIVAFVNGKTLTNEEKLEEKGKKYYQKFLLTAGSASLVLIISIIMLAFLK